MKLRWMLYWLLVLLLSGCADKALPPVEFAAPARSIDYQIEVKPILVKRCVVCHSCYNSPCQLKLSSFEGLDRGASKKAVYDAARLQTMEPTRLFMDAHSTEQWRQKGFVSVTENHSTCGGNDSLMLQLLAHKNSNSMQAGDTFYPEAEDLACPGNSTELGAFLKKHPNRGMPFGFPPLTREQFETIAGWIVQGAKGPSASEQAAMQAVPEEDREMLRRWEEFLNLPDAKYRMTARYLYEHLFLAHLNVGNSSFYELVRSSTPPGQKIQVIATVRPYDDPQTDEFYYRLRRIHSTIVHKTHMVFDFSVAQLERIKEIFIEPDWLEEPHWLGFQQVAGAKPFLVFEQIPPKARYQFLLDNIHYVIMTFIRGPVCKGQVALNVVRDHFWLLFLDPEYDLAVQHPGFLSLNANLLDMPAVEDNDRRLLRATVSREYRQKSTAYVRERQAFYQANYHFQPLDERAIWKGTREGDSPLLTVFRHFDSASVHRGPLGSLPQTVWVMDYPLVERIYYSLVAGFDVYGTMIHQLATRIYMDTLRQEGETYFLDFMPKDERWQMMKEWYGGMDIEDGKIRYSPSALETGVTFSTSDPKRELVERVVETHFPANLGMKFDHNYLRAGEDYPPLPQQYLGIKDFIQGFKAVTRPGTAFFRYVKDYNANLAYIRVKVNDSPADDVYLSMIINRWHDDVTTLFGEKLRLDPTKDQAVFVEGFVGSYPNYFYELTLADLPDFLASLRDFGEVEGAADKMKSYGVNRSREDFWEVYDRFQQRFDQTDAVQAGLFDLNRYYHLAF